MFAWESRSILYPSSMWVPSSSSISTSATVARYVYIFIRTFILKILFISYSPFDSWAASTPPRILKVCWSVWTISYLLLGFVTVAGPSQVWIFLDLCIVLFRNVARTGAMVELETSLGDNILQLAYFLRHDNINPWPLFLWTYRQILRSNFPQPYFQQRRQ